MINYRNFGSNLNPRANTSLGFLKDLCNVAEPLKHTEHFSKDIFPKQSLIRFTNKSKLVTVCVNQKERIKKLFYRP